MGGLSITGYVLEPPRVGAANSPYTQTPNVYIYDQGAFDSAYPSNESAPRTDYLVFVHEDGDLYGASFHWTKNEVINRFDYDGLQQRFRTLPGAPRESLGTISSTSNDTGSRLAVTSIPISSDLVSYPIRVALGPGAGTTFAVNIVLDDSSFGSPSAGTVELSEDTGNLNWATADLSTWGGSEVYFQRQSFFDRSDSDGRLGVIEDTLILSPLPATGQSPLVRTGYRQYLTPIEVVSFGSPVSGTVEWKVSTGELRFSSADSSTYAGASVYYDGVVMSYGDEVSRVSVGTVSSPGTVSTSIPEENDLFFQATGTSIPGGFVQFPGIEWVDAFSTNGKSGVVEVRRSDGQVQFSLADQTSYGSGDAWAVNAELEIERGVALRLFRTPVDLEGADTTTLKDVSSLYSAEGATWASPIIGSPYVTLPATPAEDQTVDIEVSQGTGSFTGSLPDLSSASPTPGFGYILNLDENRVEYARYREGLVLDQPSSYEATQLPDSLVYSSNLVLELEDTAGGGTYTFLTIGEDVLFDYTAGLMTFVETGGVLVTSGDTGVTGGFNGTNFTDLSGDFLTPPVSAGDLLIVTSGTAAGLYTVQSVSNTVLGVDVSGGVESNLSYEVRRGSEILADRFFKDVPPVDPNTNVERVWELGVASNGPRLSVDTAFVDDYRFWFNRTDFSTSVSTVANDASFTAPGLLGEFEVEISEDTGNLNFSQDAVNAGHTVLSMRSLTLGTDYELQPPLGFLEFNDRMLENEEVYVTYAVVDENDEKQVVEERGVFLVRKELTADHPTPTSTLSFNSLGREVASTPSPEAFRGGRPQVTGTQVTFDTSASTATFLSDNQVTDALPHGSTIEPQENVYIDYYIYGAIGGEQSLTVLQPPMASVPVNIEEGATEFEIGGDRTDVFQADYLLKLDQSEVYLIGSSSYDSGTDLTTITLASLQSFQSDLLNPSLSISSGATRTSGVLFFPAYFTTDLNTWSTSPRGANRLYVQGDLTRTYTAGTVLSFTDNSTFQDFLEVTGSVYDSDTGRTEVRFLSNSPRQYDPASVTLKRSVRPILSDPTASVSTSRSPILTEEYTAYRRVEGEVGQILSSPADYSVDNSGRLEFADALQEKEELGFLYTGSTAIDAGRRVRASYVHNVAPSSNNGLEGQILKADYTTRLPDSFYWRVETFTNFRGELAQQYEQDAQSTIPSGGPRLENSSQLQLYEQGRESVWYEEGRLANEDLVARPTLKYYNDAINYLEDALQNMDGRVVGGHDGRFLFDGLIDNPVRATWVDVTNQIDDLFKVSNAPVTVSVNPSPPPKFSVTFEGTFIEVYKPNDFSRFFPTRRNLYSVATDPTGLVTGDTIVDSGVTNLRSIDQVSRRLPWAVVTEKSLSGQPVLTVDETGGLEELLRPEFDPGTYPDMPIVIQDQDGTWLLPSAGPNQDPTLNIASVTATTITLSGNLTVDIPVGATVYHIPQYDTTYTPAPASPYLKNYRVGFDVGANLQEGTLTHVVPFPPYDGSDPLVPASLEVQNPGDGEVLDIFVQTNVDSTVPERFPALDGGTEDDDNNRSFPVLTPSPVQEVDYLSKETVAIGDIQSATTDPLVATGDLDGTRTVITNSGGSWGVPTPKVNDVVEIRTGLNAFSGYYRITSVGASTISTAPEQFPSVDTGFEFAVSVSPSLAGGTGTVSPSTRITDGAANFVSAGVLPGHTVVFTSGVVLGERRQVTSVVSATELDIDAASSTGSFTYVADDSLLTFGGTSSDLIDEDLVPALAGQTKALDTNQPPSYVWSQKEAVERFLDHVRTTILGSSNGETSTGSATLTDTSVDFTAFDITSSNYVWIESGTSAGAYQVSRVTSSTTLDIQENFPDTGTGVQYEVIDTLGAGVLTLKYLQRMYAEIIAAISDVSDFQTLVTQTVSFNSDPGAHGVRTVAADLTSRLSDIVSRLDQITNLDPSTGSVASLETVMSSGDRWYDLRNTWIDTRINREKGILVKKDRAVENRVKAQAEILGQLTKLLTVKM